MDKGPMAKWQGSLILLCRASCYLALVGLPIVVPMGLYLQSSRSSHAGPPGSLIATSLLPSTFFGMFFSFFPTNSYTSFEALSNMFSI